MDQIKFNLDINKLRNTIMNSELMVYIQENQQVVNLVAIWLFSTLITFLIQSSYVFQNRSLKHEIEEHLELIETIQNENDDIKSNIIELENSKTLLESSKIELERTNFELENNVESLQKDIKQLNLKISKLKEKNVVLCESLEEFLSLRLKKRKFENSKESDGTSELNKETHCHNLRSLKTDDFEEDESTSYYNLR